jgi:hypothetical protein
MIVIVGTIGNYYGSLEVKDENDKYFWQIPDCDGIDRWEEIPKSLYDELIKFNNET